MVSETAELEPIVSALESRGYRVTSSRRSVLEAVLSQADHFTVEEILRQATGAGRATVFRTIRLLCELGVLCRVLLEDGRLHYRLAGPRHHHHHLVCVTCGRVRDLDECVVGNLVRDIAQSTGFDVQGHWLEFYGLCQSCRQAASPAE